MKKALVILLIVIILAAGGYFAYRYSRNRLVAGTTSKLQTVPAEKGDLTATVGATGVVRANQTTLLNWQTTGVVDKVQVQTGDAVTTTQVLATLQQTSLPQNIILAQADLVNNQKALEDLYKLDLSLAQAQQAVANAQKAQEDAQTRVNNLNTAAPQPDLSSAQANVVLAKNALDNAQKAFNPYADKASNNVIRAMLQNKLAEAQKRYDKAVQLLNNLQGTASNTTQSIADADLAVAKAQLNDAQTKYNDLKAGPDPNDVTTLQARIDAAKATINLSRITAPFAGTVTEVDNKPGDQVSPGMLAYRLDDLSKLLLDVQVSEVDINRIMPDQDVILTFDAIPAKEYHGKVDQVAQVGTTSQGVVDFTVTVALTDEDEFVKPGMTAAVKIIVDQLKDVLLVPNRAVRVKDGKRVVYVLRNDAAESIGITLGASSDTDSEVLQGDLKAGDLIVLNPPLEISTGGPPSFMRSGQ
jgi:HlyD family secretion protein